MFGMLEKLRLISEWSPLLAYAQRLTATTDTQVRAVIIVEAAKWLATKTETTVDDKIAAKLYAVLVTPQGEDLVRTIVDEATKLVNKQPELDE